MQENVVIATLGRRLRLAVIGGGQLVLQKRIGRAGE